MMPIRVVAEYPCDLCHQMRGVQFFDHYWVCSLCLLVLRLRLSLEAYR